MAALEMLTGVLPCEILTGTATRGAACAGRNEDARAPLGEARGL
jgi:hypothetical protein